MSDIERYVDPSTVQELAQAKAAAQEALAGGGALVPLGGASPEITKQTYALQRAEAARALTRAESAAAALREQVRRKKEELERQLTRELADLEAQLKPLREHAARLEEGLWTVNLYLGRDEQITRLAEGEPAPADEPIVLRQLVLAMDEECLIAAEKGGIDAARREDFLDWLTRDPAHLQQVLPDRKGVVVLVPSWQKRTYGNAYADKAMEKANAQSHWLIRNGDNLYMMVTDLKVGDRLLPTRAEFVEFFSTYDSFREVRVPLEPGSDAWVQAERAAGARRRHYMRIMLVLQGLADRTTVFQPLPASGVSFLDVASQDAGKVRIVNELDNVLTSGRKPFRQWQAELNAQLRPGMRIIGDFNNTAWWEVNRNRELKRYGHSRLTPEGAEYPSSHVPYPIEAKDGRYLKFLYKRTQEEWIDGELRVPKTRAACRVRPTDPFILPFDLTTEAELVAYLNARTERHAYLDMVPVLKAAIAAKRAEAAAEAPFRTMLAGRIAARHGLDVAEVEAQLPELVDWWKLANRHHRPLVTADDPQLETKAIRGIEREWAARHRAAAGADATRDARAVEQLRRDLTSSTYGEPICVARRKDGSYVAYCPEHGERDDNVWLSEHSFTKTLLFRRTRQWVILTGRSRAAMTVLWSTPEWESWNHDADRREYLTRREYAQAVAALRERIAADGEPIAVTYARGNHNDGEPRQFVAYAWAHTPRTGFYDGPRDIGRGMVQLAASWRRGRDGEVELTYGRLVFNPHWKAYGSTDAPWESPDSPWAAGRPQLLWHDPQQLAKVHERQEAERRASKIARERSDRVWAIRRHVGRQWEAAEEKRQYARFLEDYAGAEDLWEGHRKTLKIEFREPDWLYHLVGRVLDAGADPSGMTIAAAAAAYPGAQTIEVPADLADLLLADPPQQDPQEER